MAVKKKSAKKKSSSKVVKTKAKTEVPAIIFPTMTDDMTLEEKLTALGKSSELLVQLQKNIAKHTAIDDKPAVVAIAVNKMYLIDKKIIYVGSEINKINRLIEQKELTEKFAESEKAKKEEVAEAVEEKAVKAEDTTLN